MKEVYLKEIEGIFYDHKGNAVDYRFNEGRPTPHRHIAPEEISQEVKEMFAPFLSEKYGGPAFPSNIQSLEGHAAFHKGMHLRDWFAGKAIQALITVGFYRDDDIEYCVRIGYKIADAVLEERKK